MRQGMKYRKLCRCTKKKRFARQSVDNVFSAAAPNKRRDDHAQNREDNNDRKRVINRILNTFGTGFTPLCKKTDRNRDH